MHVITSTFTLGLAHSLILDLRFRVYVHPATDVRGAQRPDRRENRGRDGQYRVAPRLQPRRARDVRRRAARRKLASRARRPNPRRSRCTATYPSGSSPSCGASVFARFAKAATPINKYQDPEQRGEHGKPYPVTTMRHNPLHRLDSTEIPAVSIAIPISIPITIPIAVPRIEPPRARCWRNVCAHDDTRRQDYSERRHATTVGVRRRHY